MILCLNTSLIGAGVGTYQRGLHPHVDKLDILKYVLASYAVLEASEIHLWITLQDPYHLRRPELESWVEMVFEGRAQLYNYRHENQRMWKDLAHHLCAGPDPVMWHMANHDHPFLGADLTEVRAAEQLLLQSPEPTTVYLSHWPEIGRTLPRFGSVEVLPNGFLKGTFQQMDSIQMVHTELFRRWCTAKNYGNVFLPRTDWGPMVEYRFFQTHVPPREICRHFDGYSHVFPLEIFPALTIPPGFREGKIRIRYGYPTSKEGWVQINPACTRYTCQDPEGVDYRWCLEDLPLFWKSRIAEIDINPEADLQELRGRRNEALWEELSFPSTHPYIAFPPPPHWKQYTERPLVPC